MMHQRHQITMFALTLPVLIWSLGPVAGAAASVCSPNPDEMPPFLATGVDPNMMLMIDNSASMFDLAYLGGKLDVNGKFVESVCYDESYELFPEQGYTGYFRQDQWYVYDSSSNVYKEFTGDAEETLAACNQLNYQGKDVCLGVTTSMEADGKEVKELSDFMATGNFLNWAAASKMDVAKQVLTGGKHDGANFILESRGCAGKRYVKQIQVKTTGGDAYWLALAIRPVASTRWQSGIKYNAGTVVRDLGGWYQALTSGTSTGTGVVNDTGVSWKAIDYVTQMEVFAPSTSKFDNSPCENAAREMSSEKPNQGYIKGQIDLCLKYSEEQENLDTKMSVYNHSLNDCWYAAKNNWSDAQWDAWDDQGSISRIKNGCSKLYKDVSNPEKSYPEYYNPSDPGYVCYGLGEWVNDNNTNVWKTRYGFVGSAWDRVKAAWAGDIWVIRGLRDYCKQLQVPEVVDPSDLMSNTTNFWNLPSSLVDSAVLAQQGSPMGILKGRLQAPSPAGIIHKYAEFIRMGAMVYNDNGAASECGSDGQILYDCNIAGNRDGGKVIHPIGLGNDHAAGLVSKINAVKATTWTPLAEGVFNAIGYYTQRSDLRLDERDFPIASSADPVQYYCQKNNILLLTDGASTADRARQMKNVIGDTFEQGFCDPLQGSSHLKELTRFAREGDIYNGSLLNGHSRQNIRTHIVVAGEPRVTGTDACSPDQLLEQAATNGGTELYKAHNPEQLATVLQKAFENIYAGAAAGSAASVISASRTGEGAVYQAIFWPQKKDLAENTVVWAGEVHALFVDARGRLFEDTNGDSKLNPGPGINDDKQVTIYFDEQDGLSRACYGLLDNGSCPDPKDISEVKYLWSASNRLSSLENSEIMKNPADADFISARGERKRYIFTWNDWRGDGVVHADEVIPFEAGIWNTTTMAGFHKYLGVASATEADKVTDWLRGKDQEGMRSRLHNGKTWRLGDVIHSTPTAVSRPAEGYHFLYGDRAYAQFATRYNHRRHVIYFGSNDGMLHAVNSGFYNETQRKFCTDATCSDSETNLPLGAELWAYVPHNLWPHLKCLTEPGYGQNGESHKYFVDQVPRIFDVQIFDEDEDHPGGWGTILVGGMRFGGTPITIDNRTFTSAYFVLDITNPEKPPRLLGELTYTGVEANMGYTTSVPTVVPMVEKDNHGVDRISEWYLLLGSGPTTLKGESGQRGRLAVVPLRELAKGTVPFRIPPVLPTEASKQLGSFPIRDDKSFISDPITVDFGLTYIADAVYFGTVSGNFESGWGGKLYRLVTADRGAITKPHRWRYLGQEEGWSRVNPALLLDAGKPITAAPSIGWDGRNYWVYFGSGRLYNKKDKEIRAIDEENFFTFYGIKEPMECSGGPVWDRVFLDGTPNNYPGTQGLLRVDQIQVQGHPTASLAELSCKDDPTDACLKWWFEDLSNPYRDRRPSFADLRSYIAGNNCYSTTNPPGAWTGTDGWYRRFELKGERNLGQATLLGGLTTFTTYIPSTDPCNSEGFSNLYAVFYQTGTAWHRSVFGDTHDGQNVTYSLPLGYGLAITPNLHVGTEKGAQAFVQTSTGAIVPIRQQELAADNNTGRANWRECE
jgi:type IV pilus assembly protein PilY1